MKQHFYSIVAGNCMRMDHPAEGVYAFDEADKFVEKLISGLDKEDK